MVDELAIKVFKNFMRGTHHLLNIQNPPVIEVTIRLVSGKVLSFTPGNDYTPDEDKLETATSK